MLWAIAAYITHVIEMTIHTYAVNELSPLIVMPLFYLFTTIFILAYNKIKHKSLLFPNFRNINHHKLLLSAYISGGLIGNLLWFSSVAFIGIGTVTFILVFIRVLVTGYSYFFMNDRFPVDRMIALITSFLAVFAFSYGGEEVNHIGVTFAVLSCVAFSIETITKKKLAETEIKPENIVIARSVALGLLSFLFFLALSPLNLPIYENHSEAPTITGLSFIAMAAFIGGVVSGIVTFFAMRQITLSYYEALNASKPVTMAVIGVLLFGETMTQFQILMGAIIIASSLYFLWPRNETSKEQNSSNS